MATFTIKSRHYGPVTFEVPDEGHYQIAVRVTGQQEQCVLVDGRGRAFTADADSLERRARHWWRKHLAAWRYRRPIRIRIRGAL